MVRMVGERSTCRGRRRLVAGKFLSQSWLVGLADSFGGKKSERVFWRAVWLCGQADIVWPTWARRRFLLHSAAPASLARSTQLW